MGSNQEENDGVVAENLLKYVDNEWGTEASTQVSTRPVEGVVGDVPVPAEVEQVEKELKQSSERFRRSKVHSVTTTTTDTESGPPVLHTATTTNAKKLTFQNIEAIAVKKKGIRQEILKKVSGIARPGELTFIMGSSGAGKTTLLNILTGRNLKNIETEGEVFVNNRNMTPAEMKKLSAYVQQDDVFIGMLTVRETLRFAAKLRSPHKLDKVELESIVDELLVMMSLKKCENTKVGSMTEKSLSRGERKRLAFACEILTDPPILFCDEPTSGLDSFMSHQVIKALRQLTFEGKTVVCTIHQPSTSVYHMADQLILLSQGYVAYSGPAKQVDAFFGRCGYPIPKFVSSPDHFMRVISHKSFESEDEYNRRIERIVLEHDTIQKEKSAHSSTHSSRRDLPVDLKDVFPRTWWCQFYYIFHRSATQLYRERAVLVVKLIQGVETLRMSMIMPRFETLIMSTMIGATYFQMSIEKKYLMSFKGFAFVSVQMMHMLFMMPAMTVFWKDYPVVVREFQANMYSPSAYYLAKTTADSVQYLVFPVIFSAILLGMTALPFSGYVVTHYLIINILLSLNACSIAQSFAAMCGHLATGMTVLPIVVVPLMVFGGFMINYDSIPTYFLPLAWVSWYKYGFEAITIVYFESIDKIPGCDVGGANTTVVSMSMEDNCSTGAEFIKVQAFEVSNLWLDYTVILVALLFWKILGVVAFSWRIRRA
ncbi:hypothetical protein GCK72_011697 [Caenorhabditis remanei]|uniref:ABC transporter domain-containing protein n=1 Tax=Caenorhabditis remanei TaxID=31234 RepID=A0A6A5H9D0_CAERE|nr:hypothetical protein GCK72_011697 [Caenorhabditis remanei]KAF1763431.1 hypothetical protein GCK72_011697 [Caenorhabditis remanei]